MSIMSGMNLEAGATGQDIAEIRRAPLTKRLVMAPVGLIAAEAGAQAGILVEEQLVALFAEKDKRGQRDDLWRGKVLFGKVVIAVLLYPFSAPLALGLAASGGILHLLFGWTTFAEAEDQALKRGRQLLRLGERPKGRNTQKLAEGKATESEAEDEPKESQPADKAQAEETDIDLAAKMTDPDVLHTYGKAAEQAFDRLIQQGHLPPGTKPAINEALVQEVQNLVREAQQKAA